MLRKPLAPDPEGLPLEGAIKRGGGIIRRRRALGRAVEDLVGLESRRSPGIEVELAVSEGVPTELPKEVCKDVLLVIREALANVRRHSAARRVRVALGLLRRRFRLRSQTTA